MKVYQAINAVQRDLSALGISKDRKNAAQGYNFRGIDDVYNALAPLLSKHGLCILPRILERDCVERATAKGGAMFYVTVSAEFGMPPEHMAQLQAGMWVCDLPEWDFVSYDPRMPAHLRLYVQTIPRDDTYIATMANECERFWADVCAMVARLSETDTGRLAA